MPPPWVTASVLLASLLVLAVLQYRWLDQVRLADRQRRVQLLEEAGRRFAEDLDREISRAWLCFLPQPRGELRDWVAAGFERWNETAAYPSLLSQVVYLQPVEGGGWKLYRYAAEVEPVEMTVVPAAYAPLLDRLSALIAGQRDEERGSPFLPALPGLLIPVRFWHRPGTGPPRRMAGGIRRAMADAGLLVVRFDGELLAEEMLPELARRYFAASGESEYHLVIFGPDGRPLMAAGPQPAAIPSAHADLRQSLFGFLPPEQVHDLGAQLRLWPARGAGEATMLRGRGRMEDLRRSLTAMARFDRGAGGGRWRLEVTHVAGSLDQAVGAGMRRSMALGLGVLAVLALSFWAMDRSARRAQRLAGQQLDFVAGITHELMTPLAAVRSAGQNLADAVVVEPRQVRRYGSLIESEGRRLSAMVSEILDLAGMQAGGRNLDLRPVRPARLIEEALAASWPALEQAGFAVESEIAEELPLVLVDENALVRALGNLIGNAVKYARDGGWLKLRANRAEGGVELAVEDRGPGIAKADQERIFEPFVRGRKLAGSNLPGTGIGLSLVRHVVEAHQGRVEVESSPGEGAVFRLWLPAAPEGLS